MVFKIRYRRRADGRESEMDIEANNPAEALVKFRHTCHQVQGSSSEAAESVTCVPGEVDDDEAPW